MLKLKRISITLSIILIFLSCNIHVFSATDNTEAVFLSDKGIMVGSNGNLLLDQNFTIEQLMTVLVRLAGKESEAKSFNPTNNFKDVPQDRWSAPYIAWAKANNISNGNPDGTIGYSDKVTAERLAAFVLRTLGYKDVAWNDVWKFAKMLGIFDKVNISPTDNVIRGDVAKIIYTTLETPSKSGVKLGVTLGIMDNNGNDKLISTAEISYGTLTYDNGAIYTGDLQNGIPNGQGTMTWTIGDKYIGTYSYGFQMGKGIYTWANRDSYSGDFNSNMKEGTGIYSWANGDKYVGEWKNDLMHGSGALTYANGTVLSGKWENDVYQSEISAPSIVRANALSTTEINIGWDVVIGADYYYIYYSNNPTDTWYYFSDTGGNKKAQYWSGDYSSILTNCVGSSTYYFKVTTVTDGVESGYSNIVSATTKSINTTNATIKGPLSLYSDEKKQVYIGKLTTNEFDSDSIYNEFGTYGSEFNSKSIWNEFGTYGSEFSSYSAFNEFALHPPLIKDADGSIVGKLTVKSSIVGGVNPNDLKAFLKLLGF